MLYHNVLSFFNYLNPYLDGGNYQFLPCWNGNIILLI